MALSIVVPCFNEKDTIGEILTAISNAGLGVTEVIVVDDGSTDGTQGLLSGELLNKIDKLIVHTQNLGKGAALRTGFKVATNEIVAIQDADLEYDPRELKVLMGPILEGKADVVYGSRFMGGRPHRVLYFWHMIGNRFLTLLSNMFTNLNLSDMETCYKVFRRDVIQSIEIEEKRFGFEPEITSKLAKSGCVFYEVGISYSGRTYSEGKKIGWKDGMYAIYCIFKYGFRRKETKIPFQPSGR